MKTFSDLKVAIFADGAEKAGMLEMYAKPYIKGFTTNPTLMRKAGIRDYEKFAREILQEIPDRPISFEVFADDFPDMARQARKIATWGKNIRVKIPITNTRRESAVPLCEQLDAGRHSAQRYGALHARTGAGRGRRGEGGCANLRIGLRRSYRRYRCRPCAADGRGGALPCGLTQYRAHLGKPA